MAGEIEEPFRLNFQADLLRSGSISFGRFESESLSWERRSIFSHNRYLEEVEKYSKPGTVTEKKAYFEAEFKRKALLKKLASECQDGGDSLTSGNNELHDFEESGNGNESPSSSDPSVCNREAEIQPYENEEVIALYAENGNESTHNSGYDEDILSQECESQNCEFLPVATQDEPVINMVDCPLSIPEHLKFDETQQSETEDVVGITEQSIGETLVEKEVLLDAASKPEDSSPASQTLKKDDVNTSCGSQMSSSKVKPASEKKLSRPTPKTQANVARFQKHGSYEASKGSMKPRTTESKFVPVKKTEKKLLRPATPITSSRIKTSKAEDSTSLKEKELPLKKSIVKDVRSAKTVKAQIPLSEKSLPGVHSTSNRPKQTISSSKSHIIQSPAGYSLKTDHRPEIRRELYMKSAEKTHAREVKVNRAEAKTLEKQTAQIKQFRRSLNFKATPIPSFYNETARGLDQPKATPMSKLLNQPRPSSQSRATRDDRNALNSSVPSNIRPSSSTASTNRILLSNSVKRTHIPGNNALKSSVPSNIRPSSSYSSTNRIRLTDSARKSHIPEKKAFNSSVPLNIRPSSSSASTNRIRLSESVRINHTPEKNALKFSVPSNIRPSSSYSSTNRIRLPESVRRNHTPEKKELEKKKDISLTKQKEPKPRLVKKDVTDIHTDSGPKSGHSVVC